MVHAEELRAKNDLLAAILARHLGVSVDAVAEMWRIDNYMTCASTALHSRRAGTVRWPRHAVGRPAIPRCTAHCPTDCLGTMAQAATSCRGRDSRRNRVAPKTTSQHEQGRDRGRGQREG